MPYRPAVNQEFCLMYPFLQHHICSARCALMTFGVWGKVLGRGDKYGCAMFGVRGVGKSNHDQGNVQQMSRWEIQSGKERSANT